MKTIHIARCQHFCFGLLLALSVILQGCGDSEQGGTASREAQADNSVKDTRLALVELQTAVREQPGNGELRRQLGEVRLASGDPGAAQKEFLRARELGVAEVRVVKSLGTAYLAQKNYQALLGDISVAGLTVGSEDWLQVKLMRSDAYFALDQNESARQELESVLLESPGNASALVRLGQIALSDGKNDQAQEYIEAALGSDPQNSLAWTLAGQLAHLRKDFEGALKAFSRALKQAPKNVDALSGKALARLAMGQIAPAEEAAKAVLAVQPGNYVSGYVLASVEFDRHQYGQALSRLDHLLRVYPEYYPAVLLRARTNMAAGSYQVAEDDLLRYLLVSPDDRVVRLWLADVREQSGAPARALAGLEDSLRRVPPSNGLVLARMARLALDTGKLQQASVYLSKAAEVDGDKLPGQVKQAVDKLAQGDSYGALEALRAGKDGNESGGDAGGQATAKQAEQRILGLIEDKEYQTALAEASRLVQSGAPNSIHYNVLGMAQIAAKDNQAALLSLQKAVELNPENFGAVLNLAFLYSGLGKFDSASLSFSEALELVPEHEQAMLGIANLKLMQGDRSAAAEWLRKAALAHPSSVVSRVNLGRVLLSGGDSAAALMVAREAAALQPESADVLDLLGRAQFIEGNLPGSRSSYQRIIELYPEEAAGYVRLGMIESRLGNHSEALSALSKAVRLDKANADTVSLLAQSLVLNGKYREAIKSIKVLRSLDASRPEIDALEGDAYRDWGKYGLAEKAYRRSLAKDPDVEIVRKVYFVMEKQAASAKAQEFMGEWLKRHPDDLESRLLFGQGLARAGKFKAAQEQYEMVLRGVKDNRVALNNLATVLDAQGEHTLAIAKAKKAFSLYPRDASVLDTLGWLLVRHGDPGVGLSYLEQAIALAPNQPEVLYHLAFGREKNGDRGGALEAIRRALSLQHGQVPNEVQKLSDRLEAG